MKILLVSKFGDSLSLGEKLQNEKHDVKIYVRENKIQHPLVITNPSAENTVVDLLLIEDDNSGAFVEKAKELNRPVLGGGIVADRLCKDLTFLKGVVEGCGYSLAKPETAGMAIDVAGWFNGENFIKPMFIGLRYERFGAGDVGAKSLTMGLVGCYKMKGKIFNVAKDMEVFLKANTYKGFVDIKTYINNDKIHITGIHLGLYLPLIDIISNLHSSFGNFLSKLSTSKVEIVPVQPDKISMGVVVLEKLSDISLRRPVISQVGNSIDEAISKTYKAVHKSAKEDAYYRIDIGSNYKKTIGMLKEWELL